MFTLRYNIYNNTNHIILSVKNDVWKALVIFEPSLRLGSNTPRGFSNIVFDLQKNVIGILIAPLSE